MRIEGLDVRFPRDLHMCDILPALVKRAPQKGQQKKADMLFFSVGALGHVPEAFVFKYDRLPLQQTIVGLISCSCIAAFKLSPPALCQNPMRARFWYELACKGIHIV